ncbi:MAG: hypothetical protein AAGN64_04510 [Bacteroidota bacterium]
MTSFESSGYRVQVSVVGTEEGSSILEIVSESDDDFLNQLNFKSVFNSSRILSRIQTYNTSPIEMGIIRDSVGNDFEVYKDMCGLKGRSDTGDLIRIITGNNNYSFDKIITIRDNNLYYEYDISLDGSRLCVPGFYTSFYSIVIIMRILGRGEVNGLEVQDLPELVYVVPLHEIREWGQLTYDEQLETWL